MKKREFLKVASAVGMAGMAARVPSAFAEGSDKGPIKVGILHSLSGTMAISETSLKDTALMTIAQINQAGGVMAVSYTHLRDRASMPASSPRSATCLLYTSRCV
ncbi:transporter substrate-binding protein [Burkholderia plantarii]|uniref:transporter substrate-binding protein n=1 Tax=Burkholderia plantarii TaxID=41899 RepID=UPI0009F6696D|nr:transporter substrate-binding protein [Burkholderia plantarii]